MPAREVDNTKNVHYVFDTSSLIGGIVELYCPEVFPDIWVNISELIKQKKVYIPTAVIDEIKKKNDAANEWLEKQLKAMLKPTTMKVRTAEKEIESLMRNYPGYPIRRSVADLSVIAWCKVFNAQVVTQEQPNTSQQKNIKKIPSVCAKEGIRCGSLYEMLLREGMHFINSPD